MLKKMIKRSLSKMFNTIADSKLGGDYGVIGPHGTNEDQTKLLLAGVKPIGLISHLIFNNKTPEQQYKDLVNDWEEEAKRAKENKDSQRLKDCKKCLKNNQKKYSDTAKLNDAIKKGNLKIYQFKFNHKKCPTFWDENQTSYELTTFYCQPDKEVEMLEIAKAHEIFYTGKTDDIYLPDNKDCGDYYGYSQVDINRWNNGNMLKTDTEVKINIFKQRCRIKGTLLQA